jgi:hypothetical protein
MRKKSTKLPSKPYYTVAVRFLDAASVHRIFTYRVRRGKTVHLGQGLIADTSRGPAIVVVVRIDATPQDTGLYNYKYLERKAAPL